MAEGEGFEPSVGALPPTPVYKTGGLNRSPNLPRVTIAKALSLTIQSLHLFRSNLQDRKHRA